MSDKNKHPHQPQPSEGTKINTTRKQHPDDTGAQAKMPHEKDQSVGEVSPQPSPAMEQAHADLQRGLVDTDARGVDGRPKGSKPSSA